MIDKLIASLSLSLIIFISILFHDSYSYFWYGFVNITLYSNVTQWRKKLHFIIILI